MSNKERTEKVSQQERVVIVMGPTGAGKSTFINYASKGGGEAIGHGLVSETAAIRAVSCNHPVDGGAVTLIDTPGFDDTYRSDIEILMQISEFFVKVYKKKAPVSAIVFLHRVSDNRMAGSPLKNLKLFASLCGQDAMPRVVLGTTMWNQVQHQTGELRVKELKDKFWKEMIAEGCVVKSFEDSYASAWDLIGRLPQSNNEDVLVSREMVDDRKKYNETAAGTQLKKILDTQVAAQQQAVARMDQQLLTENDPVLVTQIGNRKTQVKEKIDKAKGQLQQLKIPFGRKIVAFFTGRKARNPGIVVPSSPTSRSSV